MKALVKKSPEKGLLFEDVAEPVTGAGPIGIMAAAVCKHVGSRRVVITDINDERLLLAKKLGINYTVNTAKENLADIMQTDGK